MRKPESITLPGFRLAQRNPLRGDPSSIRNIGNVFRRVNGQARERYRLPPVRFRLAPARFHLRPVSPQLSDLSLPLAGVRRRLSSASAPVATISRALGAMRGRLPPASVAYAPREGALGVWCALRAHSGAEPGLSARGETTSPDPSCRCRAVSRPREDRFRR
jgi:hypothetical protein